MSKEIKDFKEAFKFPLIWDDTYVWTSDRNMAFQFLNKIISDNPVLISHGMQRHIVDYINGVKENPARFDLTYDPDHSMIKQGDRDFISIRGWGHLTGSGGLRLDEESAAKLQDDFAAYIIEKLSVKELENQH